MAHFEVKPFINYKSSRFGIRVTARGGFKFVPASATISTQPVTKADELGGYISLMIAKAICHQYPFDAVKVEILDRSPETAEFRLCMGKDKGDGYAAWGTSQMTASAVDWLYRNGEKVKIDVMEVIRK